MRPGEAELVWELIDLSGRATHVKRFEPSNGPEIALCKIYLLCYPGNPPPSLIIGVIALEFAKRRLRVTVSNGFQFVYTMQASFR